MSYNLGFIDDQILYDHVLETVEKYRFSIDFKEFTKNLLDPIKMTFDSKIYGQSIEDTIENEIIRQIDKSNTNHIGYFHQNIFKHIGGERWEVPIEGFDVVNEDLGIYVEMKNKHNTMNAASSQKTYMRMQNQIINNPESICMLVEVIAKKSQNINWNISLDKKKVSSDQIKRVSIDKFYEIVTGDKLAFVKICEVLPKVIEDVLSNLNRNTIENNVFETFKQISPDLLKSLYLLSFKTYEGFDDLNI